VFLVTWRAGRWPDHYVRPKAIIVEQSSFTTNVPRHPYRTDTI
jgi:hypothetical protein